MRPSVEFFFVECMLLWLRSSPLFIANESSFLKKKPSKPFCLFFELRFKGWVGEIVFGRSTVFGRHFNTGSGCPWASFRFFFQRGLEGFGFCPGLVDLVGNLVFAFLLRVGIVFIA